MCLKDEAHGHAFVVRLGAADMPLTCFRRAVFKEYIFEFYDRLYDHGLENAISMHNMLEGLLSSH